MGLPALISRAPRALDEEPRQIRQLVSFRIGDEEFGVDILMVQEIIRLPSITPIPNAPGFILGMINLRGRIIPVIDLRQRLRIRGTTRGENDRRSRILIVEMLTHITGFIVDSVSEVMKVADEEIEPTPHLVASSINADYIRGVIKMPSRLIMLLDFSRILNPREGSEMESLDLHHVPLDRDIGIPKPGIPAAAHFENH
ncbi:MAG: chemotaxis protein CheW [Syntrophobacteraceae bacterium]|nr:chemotaxis protein CheW [Syntrophobacteraceae bacterium]